MSVNQPVAPVSVVIPCYRCAMTIVRAVESVFAQSIVPTEVLLVEDYSADETIVVLRELENVWPEQIKIVQMNSNLGAASARNAGWAIATQPYIAFLDADDSWHPEKLLIQYDYMRNNREVDLCGHQCVLLRDNEMPPELPKEPRITKISAKSLLLRNAFSTPTVMLKRDMSFRFQEGARYVEDIRLWQQIAFAGLLVVRIESPLAYVHKSVYGVGGLSGRLWEMEKSELSNFFCLYQAKSIGLVPYVGVAVFSLIKFVKRLLVTALKNMGIFS